MLKTIKNIAKHSVVYTIGNVAAKVVGLVLIPLYTNPEFFTQSDFGMLAILESTFQVIVGILGFSMTASLARWYWDKKNAAKQKSIYFTCFSFLLGMSTLITTAIHFNVDPLSKLLFHTYDYANLLTLMIISASFQVLNNLNLTLIKLQSRSVHYITLQISKLLVILGITLYGVVYKSKGIEAIWEANAIGEAVILFLSLPYIIRNSTFKFEMPVLREMLNYGIPLMFASLSSVLLSVTDKYMLNSLSGLDNTAIYSFGSKIANTLKLIVTLSLSTALAPVRMKMMNEPNNQRFFSKQLSYVGFVFILVALPVCLFSYELIELVSLNAVYLESTQLVPILVFSLFIGILNINIQIGLTIRKKTKIIGSLIFLTALFNIAFNYILIPYLDVYGAAIATMLSQLFFFSLLAYNAQKHYYIPYEWRKLILLSFVYVIIVILGIYVSNYSLVVSIPIKLLCCASFPFVLYLFKFYDTDEVAALSSIFKTWKNPHKFIENVKRIIKS